MIGSVGRALRGAQAAFLLDGTLLEIDPNTFAADHQAHAGAARDQRDRDAAAQLPRAPPCRGGCARVGDQGECRPDRPADARLGGADRREFHERSPESSRRPGRSWPHRRSRVALPAPTTPSRCSWHPITRSPPPRGTFANWLARIGRETGLRFDATSGWNRYTTPAGATFHQLGAATLIGR
jgi:hypothetical protein